MVIAAEHGARTDRAAVHDVQFGDRVNGAARGSRVVSMSGRIVHFEIPFDDANRAHTFYEKAFGWDINRIPELDYSMVSTGPSGEQGPTEPGYINGGMFKREYNDSPGSLVVIDVDDIDAALVKVEELGGTTVVGRTAVGDMGWSAYFTDTEGNKIGLWQSVQRG